MVKITNGVNVYEVTTGAYETIYRHQGYQIVKENGEVDFASDSDGAEKRTADEIFMEELTEKPIAQWNKDEVRRYAAIAGIDLTGTKNVNDAKEVIKAAMNE